MLEKNSSPRIVDGMKDFKPEKNLSLPDTHRTASSPGQLRHEYISDRAYRWDGLRRGRSKLVIWQYTVSGLGECRFGDRVFPLPPGTAMLGIVPEDHCYYLPENSDGWEFLFISVQGSETVRLAELFRRRHGVTAGFAPDSGPVKFLHKILELSRERRITERYTQSLLTSHIA